MTILLKIFKKVFSNTTNKNIIRVIILALFFNLLFGTLFYYAEKDVQPELTFIDAVWWAMVTMTTVGYGDFFAKTFAGRFLISYPCMLFGIGIIGYLVGIVAENMIEHGQKKRKGLLEIKMKDHVIICNFPGEQKIIRLKQELQRNDGYKKCLVVLISDSIDQLPESLSKNNIRFVKGDPVREETLLKANLAECAGVFILAEDINDPASDTKTFAIGTQIEMMETEMKRPIKTIVELVRMENLKMMRRSHVDGIVSADGIMDVLVAQEFLYPGLNDVFQEILSNASGSQFYILENKFAGHSFGEIQKKAMDNSKKIQIVGLKKDGRSILNPDKSMILENEDELIVLAESLLDYEYFEKETLAVRS